MLNEAKLVGRGLCRGINDYGDGQVISYALFLAPKIKFILTIDKYGIIQAHKTFKRYSDSKRLLDRVHFFKKVDEKKIELSYLRIGKKLLIVEF